MSNTQEVPPVTGNRLLTLLPRPEYNRLFPNPRPISLEFKDVLYEPEALINFAYFPFSGVVSQVTVMEDGAIIELSTVGNEGMVGLPIALGIAESSSKAVVQVPVIGLRMPADTLRAETNRDSPLHDCSCVTLARFCFRFHKRLPATACIRFNSGAAAGC